MARPPFLLAEEPGGRAGQRKPVRRAARSTAPPAGRLDREYVRLGRLVQGATSLDAVLSSVIEAAGRAAGFQAAHVRRLAVGGSGAADWWPMGQAERLEALHRATLEAWREDGQDLLARVATTDEIAVVSTGSDELAAGRAAAARDAGLRWAAAFGVRADERPVALVELFSTSDAAPAGAALDLLEHARTLLEALASRDRARAAVRRAAAHVRQRERESGPAAARLRDLEERRALLLRASGVGLWEWDISTNRISLSSAGWSLLGRAPDGGDLDAAEWLERVHPDDRAALDIEIFEHLDGQSTHLESEHRIRDDDGSWRWIRIRGLAGRNGEGRPVRVAGSMADITAERTAEERDFEELFYHPLTKLPTRALLVDRLGQALGRRSRGPDHCFAVLNLGIQGLRQAANRVVAGAADELLTAIASRLGRMVRAGDTVAHIGDEEFAVLLEGIDSPEDAVQIGRRMQEAVREPIPVGDGDVVLEASVGAVVAGASYERPEELLRDAALAMRRGRQREAGVELFDHTGGRRLHKVEDLGAQFREALHKGALRLEYQPIVALDDGRIKGLEALLRWDHPVHGRIPPYEFLPLAEEQGLMGDVTYWVLGQACRQVARWDARLALPFPPTIAVNIPERQLHEEGFVERALEVVGDSGLNSSRVRFDISEGALTRDVRTAARALETLKEHGVLAAIDDFGTGHLSLGSLHRFPIGVIKIDRSLVSGAAARSNDWYVARTIVELARVLELDVIAEGIETREQFQRLRSMGCRQGQGFFFSGPVPPPVAERLIKDGYPLDLRAPAR